MSDVPHALRYAKSHEWAEFEDGQTVRVGITDFAQQELGDLVYVELPKVGRKLRAGEPCAVVESVKTASDLHSPAEGEVIEINESVRQAPEQINDRPYQAWLFRLKADSPDGLAGLMSADDYRRLISQ